MIFSKKHIAFFAIITSFLAYFYIAYFLERTSFYELLLGWIFLFGCFYYFLKNQELSFKNLVVLSVLFRLIFIVAIPNLSQDFYRFIWDGRMIFEGFNPYLSTPVSFISEGIFPINQAQELYEGMGELNGSHFTNYPPIHQFGFLIAAFFSNTSILGSVIVFRLLLIFSDIGILYFGKKLLQKLKLPERQVFWYVLNPFVIIELTGNLHFEPIMLFFLVVSLYYLQQQKLIIGAILFACSISVKLIPFLFLPLFFQWLVLSKATKKIHHNEVFKNLLKWKNIYKILIFYGTILTISVLLFLPFMSSELLTNYSKSVGLWFDNFEFNASFYYLFREIGFWFRGYNEIAIIGKIMAFCSAAFLVALTFFRDNTTFKKLLISMLLGISFYYFFSTTVHPWYLGTLLVLGVFTNFKFPVIWTFLVVLSYQAYSNFPWKENLWWVFFEYIFLFSYLIYELKEHFTKKIYI